jgi:hypothetical protein
MDEVQMRTNSVTIWIFSVGLGLVPQIRAQTNTNVVLVAFTTLNSTPLNAGFAGFTTEVLGTGVEFGDTNMQRLATTLSPGWVLFPGGTTADAFDWSTGLTVQSWVDQLGAFGDTTASNLSQGTYEALIGKGGAWFTNFAGMAENIGGARIIVCINAFTDTTNSAGGFAQFALSNHIPVAVWELCNEPYLFQGTNNFFANGADYANKMKPYRDAIKAADSNAVVAVFFTDPGLPGPAWNKALGKYTNQYWDAVAYHHYPRLPTNSSFADLMALDNGILLSNAISYVTNDLMTNNRANVTYLLTEMGPTLGNGDGTQNLPTSTLYAGIYASEYVMRLSTIPQMSFAGSYQLINPAGVDETNKYRNAVTTAAAGHYVTNTIGLPFGYFLSAQGTAEGVAYWALNRSTAVCPTTVGATGPIVPTDTSGAGTMPAVYAQAYQGGNGKRYVLLTNKGSNAVPVQITQDGVLLSNQFLETFVTASDPSVVNANPPRNNVAIQTSNATNLITVPEYSVMRLEWTVFNVPQPVLGIASPPPGFGLQWTGLTNVTYAVEATTNFGMWATLGKVSNTVTNFSFTDVNTETLRFYRLTVP